MSSSDTSATTSAATSSTTAAGATGSITVLAAASLTESFTTIANDFEAAHPGSTVTLSFGPSSGLATQVVNGAPADVFAAASTKTMGTVVDAGYASGPTNFATNSMTIVVPSKNPAKVDSLDDLTNPDTLVAVCQAEVLCGAAAASGPAATVGGGSQRRHRHREARRRQRHHELPDRRHLQGAEPGAGQGVRRLRPLRRGSSRPGPSGLCRALGRPPPPGKMSV